MAALPWISYLQRMVGRGHPTLADTLNTPLRELLTQSGYDPDASPFPGFMGPVFNAAAYPGATSVDKLNAAIVAAVAAGGLINVYVPASLGITSLAGVTGHFDGTNAGTGIKLLYPAGAIYAPHGNTNYNNGDSTPWGQVNFYSQIKSMGAPGAGGADTQIIAGKHRSGGADYDILLAAERVGGVNGTGVVMCGLDFKVPVFLNTPLRHNGEMYITQSDNSAFIGFPEAGGVGTLYGKLKGGNGAGLSYIVRIGSATGFFTVENAAGTASIFTVDNSGLARAASAVYSGVGTLTAPVATQYRVPAVLFQTANLSTTSVSDASITSFNLLGGTLGVGSSAVRIWAGGRQATQNGSFNIKFGATVLFTVVPLAGENWLVDIKVTRIGAANERLTGITARNATVAVVTALAAETLSSDVLIDFRGSVTSGGTLQLDDASIEYMSGV